MFRPFHSVEKELHEIDEDFNTGYMNAFGVQGTHEEIFREVRKVLDLQAQRQVKAQALMKPLREDDLLDRAGDVSSLDSALEGLTKAVPGREATIRGVSETLRQSAKHLETINEAVQKLNLIPGVENR